MYVEETGEIRMGRAGKLRRTKPPPCDDPNDKCPKGHWSKPIEIRKQDIALLNLQRHAKATGGASLTEAERNDPVCLYAIGRLNEATEAMEAGRLAAAIATNVIAASAAITKARGG